MFVIMGSGCSPQYCQIHSYRGASGEWIVLREERSATGFVKMQIWKAFVHTDMEVLMKKSGVCVDVRK